MGVLLNEREESLLCGCADYTLVQIKWYHGTLHSLNYVLQSLFGRSSIRDSLESPYLLERGSQSLDIQITTWTFNLQHPNFFKLKDSLNYFDSIGTPTNLISLIKQIFLWFGAWSRNKELIKQFNDLGQFPLSSFQDVIAHWVMCITSFIAPIRHQKEATVLQNIPVNWNIPSGKQDLQTQKIKLAKVQDTYNSLISGRPRNLQNSQRPFLKVT